MEELTKLRQWLMTYPNWQDGQLSVDYLGATPGCAGLYPLGVEELERRETVMGGVRVRCRCVFSLHRMVQAKEDGADDAAWLLELQKWVRQQSAMGLAPVFGDEPAAEYIRAEKGRRKESAQAGYGVYTVTITAEFVKNY